jgi:hypothetical protein
MARLLLALTVVLLAFAAPLLRAQSPLGKPLESGGFVIYSPNRETRMRLARLAEDAAQEWEKTTGVKPSSAEPVIIVDKTRGAKPRGVGGAQCSLFEVEDGGLKVQLDLHELWAMRAGRFETEVLRALALRTMHRKNPPKPGKTYAQPPGWLVEGLGEELRRRGGTVPDGVHAALIRSDRPPELGEFLRQRPERLDATSLLLYRAQAQALVKVLAGSKTSQKRFLDYLEKSPQLIDPAGLLAVFPDAAPDLRGLTRIWTLALARGSMPPRLASLTVEKTNEELALILDLEVPADPKKPNSTGASGTAALSLAARGQGGAFLMRQRSADLLNLEFRAHPLLRPVVEEYRNITMLLAAKPKAKVDRRIEDIEKIRVLLVERQKAISDYLNWFEATQIDDSDTSLAEETRPSPVPPRRDPITLHIDAVERRGW